MNFWAGAAIKLCTSHCRAERENSYLLADHNLLEHLEDQGFLGSTPTHQHQLLFYQWVSDLLNITSLYFQLNYSSIRWSLLNESSRFPRTKILQVNSISLPRCPSGSNEKWRRLHCAYHGDMSYLSEQFSVQSRTRVTRVLRKTKENQKGEMSIYM